jgi:hypothetical protein
MQLLSLTKYFFKNLVLKTLFLVLRAVQGQVIMHKVNHWAENF